MHGVIMKFFEVYRRV